MLAIVMRTARVKLVGRPHRGRRRGKGKRQTPTGFLFSVSAPLFRQGRLRGLLSCRGRAAQQPFDFLPERLPHLPLRLGDVSKRPVADADHGGKAAKGFEHLAGGGRLGGVGAGQSLRLPRYLGAEQRQGLLPQSYAGGLRGRGERLLGHLTEPQLPLRLGLPRGDRVAVAFHPRGDLRGVRGT